MRTIKFRGKTAEVNWVYGNLSTLNKGIEDLISAGTYISNSVGSPFAYAVAPETVGQFTGLFDKNGKEIYEGDIIFESTDGINTDWKIGYDVSLSQYRAENIGDECDYIQLNAVYLDSSEIIGNIHDNPELLNPDSE